jgi:diadenylate cyclase
MVRRIADEVDTYIVELGTDARLIRLQLDELMGDVEDEGYLVIQDYIAASTWDADRAIAALATLDTEELLDLRAVAATLHLPGGGADLDRPLQPRGYRLLAKVPRLPDGVIDHIVDRFGSLQKIMRATIDDLDNVEGVGEARARAIKEGLSRLTETSILDRYS